MSTLRNAAQQALTEMANARDYIWLLEEGGTGVSEKEILNKIANVITDLRAALKEPVHDPQLERIHPLDMPLEVFVADLSTRPRNIINCEMGYFAMLGDEYIKHPLKVRHLLMFSRKEMRKWPKLGKRSLNEIEEMLRSRGLQLWDKHDERSLRLLREHPTYFNAAPSGVQE